MVQLSSEASNALVYVSYGSFLILGISIAFLYRNRLEGQFISGNRTQTALPLAFNFVAAGMGSGVFFSYPQMSTLTGVQGLVIYALASALPMLLFATVGTRIRKICPDGFMLTEWTRERFGKVAACYLSLMSLITLFLYMVSELSAMGQVITALTGLDGLPMIIVECVVTTIYTSIGGFRISFITDIIQGIMMCGLVIIATITIGTNTNIDRSLVESSGLLKASTLGWQMLYILPISLFTNFFFLAQFWLRTFAAKTDRDLWIGASVSSVILIMILTLVGSTGLIATFTGDFPGDPPQDGSVAMFLLLERMPAWVGGIVLVMTVTMSTAGFDSLQSAMVSSVSNDFFRNKINIWWIRSFVVVIIVPIVVIALKAPSILRIYFISNLVSSAAIPILMLGLMTRFHWLRGVDIVVGGLGGLFTVFLFGLVYYRSAKEAGKLLIIDQGFTSGDWGVFGAFVAAPVGALLWGFACAGIRLLIARGLAWRNGTEFQWPKKPVAGGDVDGDSVEPVVVDGPVKPKTGAFY